MAQMDTKPGSSAAGGKGRKDGVLGRITTARIVSQAFFFAAFVGLFALTSYVYLADNPRLIGWVSKLLEIDPLVGVSTALTTHTIYSGLIFSLIILLLTIALGRVFCNWICPFGTLHHFTGWAFGRFGTKQRIEANRYRRSYGIKYMILIAMLVAAVFGSLQIGLLDPIATIHRSVTIGVMPALQDAAPETFGDVRIYMVAWLVGFMLLALLLLNLVIPRWFCRVLCPLGAFLGVFSRFSIWRIHRDRDKCTSCGLCRTHCEGACDPDTSLRKSECLVCFNCIESCPHDALKFGYLPPQDTQVTNPDLDRRKVVVAGLAGLAFIPLAKAGGRSGEAFQSSVIRPPGTVEEQEFLKRCIKCGQCMRVCPTNVIQPAMFQSGVEGMWTPIMNYRVGACQFNCVACGQVCPTGAIQRISIERKLGVGKYAAAGPVRLGLANYDLGRCLPWGKGMPCLVCEEVCPVSPKAIYAEWRQFVMRHGKKMVTAATPETVTLAEMPHGGQLRPEPTVLRPNSLQGDNSQRYYVRVHHADGTTETHRIIGNSVDTVRIDGAFTRVPGNNDVVALLNEIQVPKIDSTRCIGCGLCEKECVIVGDRRGVYVTAAGETRSHGYGERDRSIRLVKGQG
jgi:polyferredoxin